MTKVNLKDATKELTQDAGKVLAEATGIRKRADALIQSLRELERAYQRQADEENARIKQEEQLRARSAQSKAYTSESGFAVEEEAPQVIAAEPEAVASAAAPPSRAAILFSKTSLVGFIRRV